jgi:hypothetical protein
MDLGMTGTAEARGRKQNYIVREIQREVASGRGLRGSRTKKETKEMLEA